jgi:MFS family permease
MENMKPAEKWAGWRVVIIAALILIFVGNFWSNATTLANTAMMSSENPIVTRSQYGLTYSINQWTSAGASLIMGFVCQKYGAKKLFITGAVLQIVGGLILVNFMGGEHGAFFYTLNYGVIGALGYCLTASIPGNYINNNWLVKRRGTGSSLLNIGTVFAGVVTPPVVTALMSRFGGWQVGYRFYGVMAIIGLVLSLFIINKPSDIGQYPDNNPDFADPAKIAEITRQMKASKVSTVYKNIQPDKQYTLAQAVKTPLFWILLVALVCTQFCATFMMNPGSVLFTEAGIPLESLSIILSLRQVFRVIFLVAMMRYFDRIEPLFITICCLVFVVIAYAIAANPTSLWQCMLFYAAGSIVMSMSLAAGGVIIGNIFGHAYFAKVWGFFVCLRAFLSGFSSTISGNLHAATGSYAAAAYLHVGIAMVGIVFCAIALVIVLKRKKAEETE